MPEQPLNILLIEDNPDHADLFLANLSLTAYAHAQVVRQETLRGGQAALADGQFDLLFIDLSLQDSSIAETMTQLRDMGLSCGCPVIVLTSLDDRSTILDIIRKGADDCLPKLELNDTLLERIIHFNLDRWRLRQQLLRSEEAYKDLYDNSPNMLGSVDVATRKVLTCNQTFARKTGYSMEEIIGRRIDEFYHPDCLEHFQKVFASFLRTGVIRNAEIKIRRKDGAVIDVLLNVSAVRDEQGNILHTRSTWIDITEKHAAERELQHIQQLNRLIIDTIPDLLWLKDADGVYLACNPRFEEFFGAPEAEIIGRTDYDFVSKELSDAFRMYDKKAATARKTLVNEEWVTLADGKEILLETTKAPLIDDDGSLAGVMGIGHDITERHEAAQKIEAASRAKSVFLSSMSHELRTPLNAILGYTQIFLNDESLTDRQRSGISTIHQAGEHLLLLINDILDISRIESGKMELIETEFCLGSFLQGIGDIIQLRARDKGLDFLLETKTLPSVIIADELRLRQVLLNLLTNAVKFTGSGWCALKVRAEGIGEGRVRLDIAVEDSGPGISADEQQLIFEPFLQVGERLQHREGTGLGLAISREMVRLMGGELHVLSPVSSRTEDGTGPGCRFFFSIEAPVSNHQINPARQQRKVIGYTCPWQPGLPLRVLVVDDKLSNRAVLRDTLEPLGFLIQEAADGVEVPAACGRFWPHIILMDLRMPKVDGFTAAVDLKRQPEFRHIPIVAVTASIAEGDIFRRRCLENGFCDYIHKPFSAAELLEIMADHLKIELIYSKTKTAAEQEAIVLPPQELLDALDALAEVGEIQGLSDKIAEIAQMEAGKYRVFARRAQELAEDFNFTSLLDLAAGRLNQ
jgi:PAS domain S-box-containing protein